MATGGRCEGRRRQAVARTSRRSSGRQRKGSWAGAAVKGAGTDSWQEGRPGRELYRD